MTARSSLAGQWQRVNREVDAKLRAVARAEVLLYAGQKPTIHRHVRGVRGNSQRDQIRINPPPDVRPVLLLTGDWIEGNNGNHPHSGLRWVLVSRVNQGQN